MAHITKFKLATMGQILAHVNRDGTERKYSNAEIDASRTHLNYHFKSGTIETLQTRLDEVSHTKRKDLVACCGVCITLPQELASADEAKQRRFFELCKQFLDKKFGAENCVYSTVHCDETTPHMHYGFIPVVAKERKYRSADKRGKTYRQERICAKEVITRDMLRTFHDDLQVFITCNMPGISVVHEDKRSRLHKNLSLATLKSATFSAEQSLEEHLNKLTTKRIVRKKAVLGRVILSESEYNLLADSAELVDNVRAEKERLNDTASCKALQKVQAENALFKQELKAYTELKSEVVQLRADRDRFAEEKLELFTQLEIAKKALREVAKEAWEHLSAYAQTCLEACGVKKSRGIRR